MSSRTRLQPYLLTDLIGGAVLTGHRTDTELQMALYRLADRLRFLSPSHRDPERFHAEKSVLVHELRLLARGRVAG